MQRVPAASSSSALPIVTAFQAADAEPPTEQFTMRPVPADTTLLLAPGAPGEPTRVGPGEPGFLPAVVREVPPVQTPAEEATAVFTTRSQPTQGPQDDADSRLKRKLVWINLACVAAVLIGLLLLSLG